MHVEGEHEMSVTLTTHPSFRDYLIAECDAPNEETARALVEATARRAGCDVMPETHAGPRPYAQVHVWFLAPRCSEAAREWGVARAA
jgi:hypothetical protein